jgi:EAL domain-containing protein (putative c-di-GMP-specific phosphodiesterase class I)/GGDEF domain-containing protein
MADIYEAARIDALRKLDLLDTPPSEAFDRVTRMAARLFNLPIAAVSLTDTDRQWFKSRVGVEHCSIPRMKAPCAAVADSARVLVLNDLQADPDYSGSPLAASGVRFYAGAPLTTSDGYCLGAMCVLGTEPRQITPDEQAALSDMAAMVMAQIELQHAVGRRDPVSGLPNRTQFFEDLADMAQDRADGERRCAVLVNLASAEQLSNAARVMGASYLDGMVAEAVRALRSCLPGGARLYHVATTQFVFVAPCGMSEADCAAGLQPWLERRHSWSSSRFVTTPAIGIAPFTLGGLAAPDVLRTAHSAMLDAYQSGQGTGIYSSAQDAAYRRRFTLLNEFGRALESPDQLRLVYQPRIDLRSGQCVSVEALLRWSHPELGPVPPGEFMPIVEQTSMAAPVTAWVIDAALRQLAVWRGEGTLLGMSVNVAAPNLLEPGFAAMVKELLVRHRIPAHWLELEVTESAAMENEGVAHACLHALKRGGIRIAIDDFGTGYSSLSYLQTIPAHAVKIDQSFVRTMDSDERKRALVSTMIKLSHDLGYRVVAEGVETETSRAFLRSQGCDEAQGYLFARPMPPQTVSAVFREPWRVAA